MGHYKLIVNPESGKGSAREKIPLVEQVLGEYKINYEMVLTERVGHAQDLAREAAGKDYQTIIAMGGDGTINEIINGLMEAKLTEKKIPLLGVIPVGRGNDFVYGVNIPPDVHEACAIIHRNEVFSMDVGRIRGGFFPEGRYFGNGIGIGFDTIVGLEAAKLNRMKGALGYIVGALKTLISFPDPPQMEIHYNNEVIKRKSTQISIMNGKRMGGIFFMAPFSDYQDGMFDLLITEHLTRMETMKIIVMTTKGTANQFEKAINGQTAKIRIISAQGGIVCHADGETVCTNGKELEVECLPAQIQIISRDKTQPENHA